MKKTLGLEYWNIFGFLVSIITLYNKNQISKFPLNFNWKFMLNLFVFIKRGTYNLDWLLHLTHLHTLRSWGAIGQLVYTMFRFVVHLCKHFRWLVYGNDFHLSWCKYTCMCIVSKKLNHFNTANFQYRWIGTETWPTVNCMCT